MMSRYEYLFPYEKIPYGSKIIIYGAGILGKEYLEQLKITQYCEVVGFVDKNANVIVSFGVPIYLPQQIQTLSFDYIVVALRSDHFLRDVMRVLCENGVPDEAIVFVGQRENALIQLQFSNMDDSVCESDKNYAYNAYNIKSVLPIALNIRGGIGDMIIAKRFVDELIRLIPNCLIDIYCIYDLSWLYLDCTSVNKLVRDNATYYQKNCMRYVLGITIKTYFLQVDNWNRESLKAKYPNVEDKICHLIEASKKEAGVISPIYPQYVAYMRRIYKGYNCYTGYSYDGLFDVSDTKVHIPLDESFAPIFERLNIHRYITVNFGNGDSADMRIVAKAWPMDYFETTIEMFKARYPDIQVVQLGTKSAEKIRGADRYILGESFELVKYILKESMIHLDIEGGLVHLATQLGTKCIVLFGPTNVLYVGYPQNINIKAGKCHDCYGLYNDLGICARGMEKPECMYSITPDIVMEALKKFLAQNKGLME